MKPSLEILDLLHEYEKRFPFEIDTNKKWIISICAWLDVQYAIKNSTNQMKKKKVNKLKKAVTAKSKKALKAKKK